MVPTGGASQLKNNPMYFLFFLLFDVLFVIFVAHGVVHRVACKILIAVGFWVSCTVELLMLRTAQTYCAPLLYVAYVSCPSLDGTGQYRRGLGGLRDSGVVCGREFILLYTLSHRR